MAGASHRWQKQFASAALSGVLRAIFYDRQLFVLSTGLLFEFKPRCLEAGCGYLGRSRHLPAMP